MLLIVNLKCATKPTYLRTSWVIFEICEKLQAVNSPRACSKIRDADGGSMRVGKEIICEKNKAGKNREMALHFWTKWRKETAERHVSQFSGAFLMKGDFDSSV